MAVLALNHWSLGRRKLFGVALLTGSYLLLIAIINTLHFQLLPVRVVLYDTVLDVMIAGAATVALYLLMLRDRLALTDTEAWLSIACGLLMGLVYAISIPAVIDRSLSIYILEKIDQRGGGIRQDAFDRVFKDEYMVEHRLVDIRLTEQLNSGTIAVKDGCVVLTDRGKSIVAFTRFYRTRMLPRHREIMGEYTDALTDPFRNSKADASYRCQAAGR